MICAWTARTATMRCARVAGARAFSAAPSFRHSADSHNIPAPRERQSPAQEMRNGRRLLQASAGDESETTAIILGMQCCAVCVCVYRAVGHCCLFATVGVSRGIVRAWRGRYYVRSRRRRPTGAPPSGYTYIYIYKNPPSFPPTDTLYGQYIRRASERASVRRRRHNGGVGWLGGGIIREAHANGPRADLYITI